ncbi:hypothetical protein HDE_02200 [Halotydeus destructor]|nr:hypothetical protein HDE_02200 [Halotydeus destructor]
MMATKPAIIMVSLVILASILTSHALKCFSCKSIGTENDECDDPFDADRHLGPRTCPPNEKCVKILGHRKRDGQDIVVRDCFRTMYEPRGGQGYRNKSLVYYDNKIDGRIFVCNGNLCNSSMGLNYSFKIILISIFFFLFC